MKHFVGSLGDSCTDTNLSTGLAFKLVLSFSLLPFGARSVGLKLSDLVNLALIRLPVLWSSRICIPLV